MGETTLFDDCYAENGSNSADSQGQLLQCVIGKLEDRQDEVAKSIDAFFLIYAGSLVFFMQAGFAMLCAGCVRLKNVQNTMLKNLLDACGGALAFYTVGYAFAYGNSGEGAQKSFIGREGFFMLDVDDFAFWLFQYTFAASAATIIAGTLAERCQMTAYLGYSVVLAGFVYPVIVHTIWSSAGFLSAFATEPLWQSGMIDFAGSGVVHMTGGATALIATYILGPRRGRFYDDRGVKLAKPRPFPGHSVALQVLGSFVLWFGWYGFNAGSALTITGPAGGRVAALAAVNTTLAASAGSVTALFLNLVVVERQTGEATFNITYAMNGCLAGLVSITAGCSVVEPWGAVVIGGIAGVLYLGTTNLLVTLCLDDAVDAIPVHLVNGLWGIVAVGLFASPGPLLDAYDRSDHPGVFYSFAEGGFDATLLACQLIGAAFITGWVVLVKLPFFVFLNYMGWFRSDSLEEVVGLDISYHGSSGAGPQAVEDVKHEYVEAFFRRRDEQMRHRSQRASAAEATILESSDEFIGHGVDRVLPASNGR